MVSKLLMFINVCQKRVYTENFGMNLFEGWNCHRKNIINSLYQFFVFPHSSSRKHHGLLGNKILHFSLLFFLANLEVEFLKKVFTSEFLKRFTERVHKRLLNKHATRVLHMILRGTVTLVSRFLENNWLNKKLGDCATWDYSFLCPFAPVEPSFHFLL